MRNNKASLEKVILDFTKIGYQVDYHLYHAADFGVPPNKRSRFYCGNTTGNRFSTSKDSSLKKMNHITASQAIADLETIPEDESINHVWSKANRSPEQGDRCLKADRPGYTIRAECHGNIQFHYSQPRRISMREAARIQSFPDDFIFQSKLRETERQVGNAVPPVLSWHIAKAVLRVLK